jgi:5-methyltetrahydrofolate--homocysteine methyltransferase
MLIVGERINSSRPKIAEAIRGRDAAFIQDEARRQVVAGAQMLDVNAGASLDTEPQDLVWLVETVQGAVDVPLCLDSPRPEALRKAARAHRGVPLVNSITGERARQEAVLPVVADSGASVVALTMGEAGMPRTAEDRVRVAAEIVRAVQAAGVPLERVYFDPVISALATDHTQGREVLEAVGRIRREFAPAHVIAGLSNIGFGLPSRRLLNHTFLVMLMAAGMDAVIADPTTEGFPETVAAAQALLGEDEFCMAYISRCRPRGG